MNKWSELKEELYDYIVNQKKSYLELGRIYGVSGNAIIKAAKRLSIPLEARRKINPKETFGKGLYKKERKEYICKNCGKEFPAYSSSKKLFCSSKCQMEYQSKLKYQEYLQHPEKYEGQSNMSWVKKYILQEQNNKCSICGCENTWNNKPLVFILDHIDGHANNNNRDNLRLVCPNCDSQLETYKSKNKNSDRIYHHIHHR